MYRMFSFCFLLSIEIYGIYYLIQENFEVLLAPSCLSKNKTYN